MGHYREILPQMVSVSRNCRLTNELAIAIAEKLSPEEFVKFKEWMKIIDSEQSMKTNNTIKKFRVF